MGEDRFTLMDYHRFDNKYLGEKLGYVKVYKNHHGYLLAFGTKDDHDFIMNPGDTITQEQIDKMLKKENNK